MDIASAAAVMCTNPGSIHDYLGIGLVKNPGIPSILIPTTSGTGAEATPNSILADTEAKLKKAIVSPHIFANLVILDPELSMTMPQDVTSWSGIDALTHAIECYTSNKANVFSDLLAEDAIIRIGNHLIEGVDFNSRILKLFADLLIESEFQDSFIGHQKCSFGIKYLDLFFQLIDRPHSGKNVAG